MINCSVGMHSITAGLARLSERNVVNPTRSIVSSKIEAEFYQVSS